MEVRTESELTEEQRTERREAEPEIERRRISEREQRLRAISEEDIAKIKSIIALVEGTSADVDVAVQTEAAVEEGLRKVDFDEAEPGNGDPRMRDWAVTHARTLSSLSLSRGMRSWLQKHWVKLVIGIVATGIQSTSAIASIIAAVAALRSVPAGEKSLTEEQRELIRREIERWRAEPEDAFWRRIAELVDRFQLSVEAQIYLNRLTLTVCEKKVVAWSPETEKAKYVDKLFDAYTKATRTSGMYALLASPEWRHVTAASPDGTIPRYTSAELLGFALDRVNGFLAMPRPAR